MRSISSIVMIIGIFSILEIIVVTCAPEEITEPEHIIHVTGQSNTKYDKQSNSVGKAKVDTVYINNISTSGDFSPVIWVEDDSLNITINY